ncbi:MAG: hypothetical protein FJ148_00605 [Deltaproteobacteria bacterium]|nr:hypothetical protein [Deltaproteobacteria bacterium]
MSDAPDGASPRLRAAGIGQWQVVVVAGLVGIVLVSGRGSVPGVLGGAAMMYASLLLQHLAVGLVLRVGPRPGFAIGLFLLKLTLLLAIATIGLTTTLLAPMSFAAGATSLLLAIVIDACYGNRSAVRAR